MSHLHLREIGYALLAIAIVLCLYVGAYYATVDVFDIDAFISSHHPPLTSHPRPVYSVGEWGASFFAPVHELDRIVRPQTWAIVER